MLSENNLSSDENEKKKKKHKHKKKNHRQKKETKRLSKNPIDEKNTPDQLSNTSIEISGGDIMVRPVKGRGSVRYTESIRSRSSTPRHWSTAAENRKRRHINEEDPHRHEKRKNSYHHHHPIESASPHKHQSKSLSPVNRRSSITEHQKKNSSNISQTNPLSPPTATTTNDQHQQKSSRSYRYHYSSSSSRSDSQSHRRRRRRSKTPPQSFSSVRLSSASSTYDQFKIKHVDVTHTDPKSSSSTRTTSSRNYDVNQQKAPTEKPNFGQIYIIKFSIDSFLGLTGRKSKKSHLSSSSSTTSSATTTHNMKPRPCLVWDTDPIRVMVMSSLGGLNFNEPDWQCASYSTDYIRRRLLPVHPKESYGGKQSIRSISKTNNSPTIIDTYLILIPVVVDKKVIKWDKLVAEYFSSDDLTYIESILFELFIEEAERKKELIKNIPDNSSSKDKDKDDEDSLPRPRSSFSNRYLSPPRKFNIIENKYFQPEAVEDSDSNDQDIIFLFNETGEQLCIVELNEFQVVGNASLTSINMIPSEYVFLMPSNEYQYDTSFSTEQRYSNKKQQINFQIEDVIKTVNISDICKRVFDLRPSSYPNWPIQILCDIHMLNDHRCITFSSIAKIHNNTETRLILLNIDSIHAKQDTIAIIDVNDEYDIPVASLYKHSAPTIFIGIDANKNNDEYKHRFFSFDWDQDFPTERKLKLKNEEVSFIIDKQCLETYCENTNQIDRRCLIFSIHLAFNSSNYLSTDIQCSTGISERAPFLVNTISRDPLIRTNHACNSKDLVNETKTCLLLPQERLNIQELRITSRKSIKAREILVAVGGWCLGDAIPSAEMFDPLKNEWISVKSMSKRRYGMGIGVLNNLLYAVGGHDGINHLNSVEQFDLQTNQWTNEIAPISSCRTSVGVGVLDGCLFAVGGQDGIFCLNLVEKYDPEAQQWICVASMGTKRSGLAVAVLHGYLYAIGGSDGQSALSTVERYNSKTNKWSSVSSMNTRRKHFGCAVYNGYIYVVGGQDDAIELSTTEKYNPKTNQWSSVVAMNSRRNEVGLAVVGNYLMATGGSDGAACLKSVEFYDSESNSWKLHSEMNYPRSGGGVGVIKVEQHDAILHPLDSTPSVVPTFLDDLKTC